MCIICWYLFQNVLTVIKWKATVDDEIEEGEALKVNNFNNLKKIKIVHI